jgi:2-polyprenyl-6-methoxyphenol hydroxylase-like FAD-dependent oxidoreductase
MDVLIIGGGVAGPVTAMALQQAGIDARIVEAHVAGPRDVGSSFTIAPNGLDALDAVGALGLAKAIGSPTRRNILQNADGRELGRPAIGSPLADGTPALTIRRPTLVRALMDEAGRRGIPIETGRRLVEATVAADGRAVARFADGGSAAADLLIGADGIHSVVRRSIDPGGPAPRYVGLTNFGGVTAAADLRRDPGLEPEAWTMIFGRRAFFGAAPMASGDVVWFVNWPRPVIDDAERRSTSDAAWSARLLELVADDPGPATDLIRAGRLELAGDSTFDLGHVPTWHRGPLLVIGDAAHAPSPSSGQGASMAAEDGVILAKALRDVRGLEAALGSYEGARRARVEKIVAAGARSSSAKIPSGVGRVIRDVAMRAIFRWVVTDRSMAWQFDHRVDWNRTLGA